MSVPKILVADDDRVIVKLLALSLKKAGYDVIVAVDGSQAMEFACKHQPDLLILDVNMPAGSGLTVLQRLQKISPMCTLPVIYLTGDKSQEVINSARELGAHSILHKPIDSVQLLATIRAALNEAVPATIR